MANEEKIARLCMPDVLKRHRNAAGLSQQQLADSVGVSKGFISALEGGRSVPNLDMLVLLAAALNVRPGELVDEMVADAAKENLLSSPVASGVSEDSCGTDSHAGMPFFARVKIISQAEGIFPRSFASEREERGMPKNSAASALVRMPLSSRMRLICPSKKNSCP